MSSVNSIDVSHDAIEQTYQKKTQLEHILLRPDSYVGSIKTEEKMLWVYDTEKDAMVERKISYNPALYKIFDEILVNASDNKIRDSKMTCIKITIDGKNNMVKIWNNGLGIPVTIHPTENMYVPTMIFGHLLTSTNFNDNEKKVVGGRNGYGAKLCNIFSTKFILETSSTKYKKSFKQTWTSNMTTAGDPVLGIAGKEDFTSVTFYPDLSRFGMTHLDKDIIDLFSRRAYDVAACTNGIAVILNGNRLPIKTFKDYVDLYIKDVVDHNNEPLKVVYEKINDRWEVAMTTSVNDLFTQVSFVNSIATTKGGTHVNYLADQAAAKLLDIAKKKSKDDKQAVKLKPAQVKMNMWIFVKSLIDNPSFDSQTKENMTLQAKDFGSTCLISEKFASQAAKTGIVDKMTMWLQFKNQALMDKKCSKNKQSKLKGIAKLDDANNAGTKNSLDCTLILTEGDSAKTLAVAGLSVIGRDNYGVFPLRGKLLNAREASSKQLVENVEINNVIRIMGLQYSQKYETIDTLRSLRYGKIMIMTDQDQDGSHIKGLIINFIHTKWPNLLKYNFLEQFITPIIKASKGNDIHCFYSIPEYKEWLRVFPQGESYHTKYYKGLGTSTGKEAKEYFSDMERHLIKFKYGGIEDEKNIILAFGKNKADERKEWLAGWMEVRKELKELGQEDEFLYGKDTKQISYTDFVKKELVLFSNMDNERSIPSVVDGLKPGQRKVMFACFKRNLIKEIKVAQLAGSVAELSSYHHGEVSLMSTIVNLAQDFVGSNNINLLEPRGQFGTRINGGKDSASPRYIFTQLSRLAKLIFHTDDMAILNYLRDDNQMVEPEWYVPVIPMVLVNGSDGIGTGWSSKVPNYNPIDLIANLRNIIGGRPMKKMIPWYRGFKGTIVEIIPNKYVINGEINTLGRNTLEIIELPVKVWTQAYKENVIEVFMNGTDKISPVITDFKEYHTDTSVRFLVEMTPEKYADAEAVGIHKFFKIQTNLACSNMVLFDDQGVVRRYESAEDIVLNFHKVRLEYYVRRKAHMVGMLAATASRLENQARFIVEKIEGLIVCENVKIKDLLDIFVARKYSPDPVIAWKKSIAKLDDEKENSENNETEEIDKNKLDFAYLTSMHIISLTTEKKDALLAERDAKIAELKALKLKTPEQLWLHDLDVLEKALLEFEADEKTNRQSSDGTMPTASSKTSKTSKTSKKGASQKRVKMNPETAPSKFGVRIEPVIDIELLKKVTADIEKKKKVTVEKNQKKMMDGYFLPLEDGDTNMTAATRENGVDNDNSNNIAEDDDEPQSLAQRLAAQGIIVSNKTVPEKPTKVKVVREKKVSENSSKKKSSPPKRKRAQWESDSDEGDDAPVYIDSDVERRESPVKRVAAKNVKYRADKDDDESPTISDAVSDADDDMVFNTQVDKPKVIAAAEPKKKMMQMKLSGGAVAEEPKTKKLKKDPKPKSSPKKKAAAAVPKKKDAAATKVKTAPKPKGEKKPKAAPKQKNGSDIDDIFIPDDEPEARSSKPRREAKKRLNVVFDSDEDDSGSEDGGKSDSSFDVSKEMQNNKKRVRMIDSD